MKLRPKGQSEAFLNPAPMTASGQLDCIMTNFLETRRLGRMRIEKLFGGVHRPMSRGALIAFGMAFQSVTATAC